MIACLNIPKLAGIAELRGLKDRVISRISIDFDKFNSDFGGSSQKMFILSALLKKLIDLRFLNIWSQTSPGVATQKTNTWNYLLKNYPNKIIFFRFLTWFFGILEKCILCPTQISQIASKSLSGRGCIFLKSRKIMSKIKKIKFCSDSYRVNSFKCLFFVHQLLGTSETRY